MAESVKQPIPSDATVAAPRRITLWPVLAILAAAAVLCFLAENPPSDSYAVCSPSHKIYTVDPQNPQVECLVIQGATIVDTGNRADVQARWRVRHRHPLFSSLLWIPRFPWSSSLPITTIDADSAVVPGLADAHAHVFHYGFKTNLDIGGCRSVNEILQRLKVYVFNHPDILNDPSSWIEGMGWDQTQWSDTRYPHADDFDTEPLLRGRRISLQRVDGHATWVSNRVLQLMGDLPYEVSGGAIIRDDKGKPTGILIDNAMLLIPAPPASSARVIEYINHTITDALAVGLTSIHDAEATPAMIAGFTEYVENTKSPIRLYVMGHVESDSYWGDQIPRLINHGIGGRLTIRSIKLVADGALGSFGAAMLEPYSDDPTTKGIMRFEPEQLSKLVKQFWDDGWQINVHCIGDQANKAVLDIFEAILSNSSSTKFADRRNRIEHAQIMTIDDLDRIGRLNVIPSVQPTHATSDMSYAEQRLGPERVKGAYAYQTLLKSANGVLPLGSDFPVEGINPILGFYAAISRLTVSGESPHGPGGWFPSEKLTRPQALKGMTLDAAYASFTEDILGSLVPGKFADYVVLDRDIMTIPYSEIPDTKVRATVVDGTVVYGCL
ncbi:amidohydrolase family-domain-containing protein [Hygrophoropsis aurantiaca]|uniref:Amidohydrolase family-domain-containing protein n=1 Tax=Hygrophoropsis aurantiaca TaxID=72124 RepID=A0ACB8AF29_9AGAM|nr:amidohydrolase family-domain-containing protein [Hygrophoropsis aurantiaca]